MTGSLHNLHTCTGTGILAGALVQYGCQDGCAHRIARLPFLAKYMDAVVVGILPSLVRSGEWAKHTYERAHSCIQVPVSTVLYLYRYCIIFYVKFNNCEARASCIMQAIK